MRALRDFIRAVVDDPVFVMVLLGIIAACILAP